MRILNTPPSSTPPYEPCHSFRPSRSGDRKSPRLRLWDHHSGVVLRSPYQVLRKLNVITGPATHFLLSIVMAYWRLSSLRLGAYLRACSGRIVPMPRDEPGTNLA